MCLTHPAAELLLFSPSLPSSNSRLTPADCACASQCWAEPTDTCPSVWGGEWGCRGIWQCWRGPPSFWVRTGWELCLWLVTTVRLDCLRLHISPSQASFAFFLFFLPPTFFREFKHRNIRQSLQWGLCCTVLFALDAQNPTHPHPSTQSLSSLLEFILQQNASFKSESRSFFPPRLCCHRELILCHRGQDPMPV